LRGEDKTSGENIIRTHNEKRLLQWSEYRNCWMISQTGIITTTLSFFAQRLPVKQYVKQLRSYPAFHVEAVKYEPLKEADKFTKDCKKKHQVTREQRNELREQFEHLIQQNPQGVISAFYRFYALPYDKRTIKKHWPEVETWTPVHIDEIGRINQVHTVYSYLYDIGKLCSIGVSLDHSVELYAKWYNTKAFKLMFASFEFAHVLSKHKKGNMISSRDRQLALRIDSVRIELLKLKDQGKAVTIGELKYLLGLQGVRARIDDLKLWVDMLAEVHGVIHNGKRKFKVNKVLAPGEFLTRFLGCKSVGYFIASKPKTCTQNYARNYAEKQTLTSASEKVIFTYPMRANKSEKTTLKTPPKTAVNVTKTKEQQTLFDQGFKNTA